MADQPPRPDYPELYAHFSQQAGGPGERAGSCNVEEFEFRQIEYDLARNRRRDVDECTEQGVGLGGVDLAVQGHPRSSPGEVDQWLPFPVVLVGMQDVERPKDVFLQRRVVQAERGHGDGADYRVGQPLEEMQSPALVQLASGKGGDVRGDPEAGATAMQGRVYFAAEGLHPPDGIQRRAAVGHLGGDPHRKLSTGQQLVPFRQGHESLEQRRLRGPAQEQLLAASSSLVEVEPDRGREVLGAGERPADVIAGPETCRTVQPPQDRHPGEATRPDLDRTCRTPSFPRQAESSGLRPVAVPRDLGISVESIHLQRLESELDRTRATVVSLRRLLRPGPAPLDVELRAVPATTVAAVEHDYVVV